MRTLTPIISVVISITIFFAFAKPLFTDVRMLQETNRRIQNQITKKNDLENTVSKLLAIKNAHNPADIERLNALVPESIDEVKVLTDLDALARALKLLLVNVSISKSVSSQVAGKGDTVSAKTAQASTGSDFNFVTTDISFGIIGTYEQFKAFLGDLERSLVLMEVTHISFSAGEGILQQYELTVRTYAMPRNPQ